MAYKWKLECVECGKKESFDDTHDLKHARWSVLAWIVESGEPRVVCPDCDYDPTGTKKKKKK